MQEPARIGCGWRACAGMLLQQRPIDWLAVGSWQLGRPAARQPPRLGDATSPSSSGPPPYLARAYLKLIALVRSLAPAAPATPATEATPPARE